MDLFQLCRQLVGIDTTPSHGTTEVVRFLSSQVSGLGAGWRMELIAGSGDQSDHPSVLFRPVGTSDHLGLVLQSHLDTADPGPYGLWTATNLNPFEARMMDGRLHGLGLLHAKGDLACKIAALSQFQKEVPAGKVSLLFTSGGETPGLMGMRQCLPLIVNRAKTIVVGIPSSMRLIKESPGFVALKISIPFSKEETEVRRVWREEENSSSHSKIFRGQSAHSSSTDFGDSAIRKTIEHLKQLPESVGLMSMDAGISVNSVPGEAFIELDFGSSDSIASRVIKCYEMLNDYFGPHQDRGTGRWTQKVDGMNVGTTQTHSDGIEMSACFRIRPGTQKFMVEEWVLEVGRRLETIGCIIGMTDFVPTFVTRPEVGLVRHCEEIQTSLGLTSLWDTSREAHEGSLTQEVGLETLAIGPGLSLGQAYRPNEWIEMSEMESATEFYRRLIERAVYEISCS